MPYTDNAGIIPARAGFTPVENPVENFLADHPRSRGVYFRANSARLPPSGSSPLARGLPPDDLSLTVRRRIIPARAGFTLHSGGQVFGEQDHPRSRGVYASHHHHMIIIMGSSPLARGLPPDMPRITGGPGIIPARAGFTMGRSDRSPPWPDHPRSRGVYKFVYKVGGLCLWIIPARAGFTRGRRRRHQ